MNLPKVVSQEKWLKARKKFLAKEKKFTEARDKLNRQRRELPMVKIEKDYVFHGPRGEAHLPDLFEGRRQLILYHFMFDPQWKKGCSSCSYIADNVGHLAHLHARDTTLVMVSRAPLEKLAEYKQQMGWTIPWYSSAGSDFNYDFQVTLDSSVAPIEYNYRPNSDPSLEDGKSHEGHGLSVFLRDGTTVYHTYSTYARGVDLLAGTNNYLDLTPLGRQEDWEEPAGRSNSTVMGWLKRHNEYGKV